MSAFQELLGQLATQQADEVRALNDELANLQGKFEALQKQNSQLRQELNSRVRVFVDKSAPTAPIICPEDDVQAIEDVEVESIAMPEEGVTIPKGGGPSRETNRRTVGKILSDMAQKDSHLPLRERLAKWITSPTFEISVALIVVVNTIVLAVEVQYLGLKTGYSMDYRFVNGPVEDSWPKAPAVFRVFERVFTMIFLTELVFKLAVLRWRFFREAMNYLDLSIVVIGLVDWIAAAAPANASTIRLLRLARLTRGFRVLKVAKLLDSLHLLIHAMSASVGALGWSILVLIIIQCIAGMIMSQLLQDFMTDESKPLDSRKRVYRYYGTFSYTMITMFEIHLANWAPACRVLVDEVSEYYGILFVCYRCLAAFAVLNVINAVFVQQTMKVAQNSQDIMIMQKQKAQEAFRRQLGTIFDQMDTSRDNMLSQEELDQMLAKRPDVQAQMVTLDIEPKDLQTLFDLFDDGDGKITSEEFLIGASRLKGPAKNIDMARLMAQVNKIDHCLQKVSKWSEVAEVAVVRM